MNPQGLNHLPPAVLLDAAEDIDEALLLLQVRQELQGADHVVPWVEHAL